MEGILIALAILGVLVFALTIFIIYFIFKILQFVIQAINLYKKMVIREDAMIKLLLDVRDNTKKYDDKNLSSEIVNNTVNQTNKYDTIIEKRKW